MNAIPTNMTVQALMVPLARYPSLPASATLQEAIVALRRGLEMSDLSGFRRALVLDEHHALVGTISMLTLLRGLEPRTLLAGPGAAYQGYAPSPQAEAGKAVELFWERVLAQGFGEEYRKTVGAVAQRVTVTVAPDAPIARALCLMLAHDVVMLPVVERGKVLGVARLVDIFDRVAGLIPNQG
jgi:CBS domain-containing protein